MKQEPLIFYRPVCGRKRYGPWRRTSLEAFKVAAHHGLAYSDGRQICLGPLTWIEKGQRRYARSRTIPVGRA